MLEEHAVTCQYFLQPFIPCGECIGVRRNDILKYLVTLCLMLIRVLKSPERSAADPPFSFVVITDLLVESGRHKTFYERTVHETLGQVHLTETQNWSCPSSSVQHILKLTN
jgi:hypothetical protein